MICKNIQPFKILNRILVVQEPKTTRSFDEKSDVFLRSLFYSSKQLLFREGSLFLFGFDSMDDTGLPQSSHQHTQQSEVEEYLSWVLHNALMQTNTAVSHLMIPVIIEQEENMRGMGNSVVNDDAIAGGSNVAPASSRKTSSQPHRQFEDTQYLSRVLFVNFVPQVFFLQQPNDAVMDNPVANDAADVSNEAQDNALVTSAIDAVTEQYIQPPAAIGGRSIDASTESSVPHENPGDNGALPIDDQLHGNGQSDVSDDGIVTGTYDLRIMANHVRKSVIQFEAGDGRISGCINLGGPYNVLPKVWKSEDHFEFSLECFAGDLEAGLSYQVVGLISFPCQIQLDSFEWWIEGNQMKFRAQRKQA